MKLGGHGVGWPVILRLAFQSIGIVYGDLGTSPLYVFAGTFPDGIKHEDDILGAFSLIFYTITLIPLIKYVFIVLKANDNGDGGTFALYSLICRYAKVGFIPSQEAADRDVSNYELETPNNRLKRASKLKSKLEKSQFSKYVLLFATMLGTCMVIGDGILTPCISVLSAVGGIKQASNKMTEDMIVWISVAVLVALFMVQRFGTDKVGYTFAPILFIWFIFIAFIGLYNFIKYDPSVIKALNPMYIIYYFERDKKQAWISLGGTVLSITGAEALFADVGHFTVRSIQLSTCTVIYPAIVLQYMGQSSYLRKHEMDALNAFYKAVPGPVYWPMFVIAVLAAVIASQSLISGTFSIIQQSLSLGCFPRVKIVHTSSKYEGQVYIPEINYLLMLACVAVTLGFRDPGKLGNAYGLAVVSVMAITSSLLVVIMIMIWKTHLLLIISYILIIGGLELLYLTAVLSKFTEGGYLPLVFSIILLAIMYTWNDVYRRKYYYELEHKISTERLKDIALNTNVCRLPGIAVFYSELVQGIPPIFSQYVSNVPVLHSLLVFVSIKSLPISKVPVDERFLFRPIKPKELNMFHCIVRYGYTDIRNEAEPFERLLVERLKAYMQEEFLINESNQNHLQSNETDNGDICVQIEEDEIENEATERDLEEVLHDTEMMEVLEKAWHTGVVHFVGDNEEICRQIQVQMNSFWWGSGGANKGIRWLSWERMCTAREGGGLGFKDLHKFNIAMLAKQGWRLINNQNPLVTNIMKAKYFPKCEFLQAQLGNNPSYMWRSIHAAKEMVKQGSRRRIGDGEQTAVWHIPWLPGDNDGYVTTDMPQELNNIRVVNLMETGSKQWDEEVLNDIFNEHDVQLIKNIPIPVQSTEDAWVWRWEKSGNFSVRSCYRAVQGLQQWTDAAFWKKIWALQVPGKVSNFAWRICRGCLPTTTALVMRSVQINIKCPWCLVKNEDATHVLFDCSFARSVWTQMKLENIGTMGYEGHITDIIKHLADTCSRNMLALILLVCWNLWNRRNRWVWDKVNVSAFGVQKMAMNMWHEWENRDVVIRRQKMGVDGESKRWYKPQQGWCKVNTDAAVFKEWDTTGIGCVIRDDHGRFLRARNQKLQALYSPREVEALGLKEALSWVKDLGYKRCVFETDAKELVEACRGVQGHTYFHLIVLECVELFKHYDEVLVDYVSRSANVVAHELARATYSMSGVHEWVDTPPDCIRDALIIDSI